MTIRVESSPTLRERRSVPQDPAIPPSAGPSGRLATIGGALLLVAAVVVVALLRTAVPDEHFTLAQKIVQRYEQGKPEHAINFNNAVYASALDELALVNPKSISATDAKAFEQELRLSIAKFNQRLEQQGEGIALARERRRSNAHAVSLARKREAMKPTGSYPECDDGEEDKDTGH